ncbi:MAG: ribosome recycling factor [Bacteroidales bacterium]|jgi:ribosome recycling factor|nr:ribosome recycling factor [Bacteroidales bacterium]HOY37792.1 ribosome recycling factor [Bacteroidales bacterium]HQP03576.1 ribosome recycling factor [Bacteroidales bacterium]
MNTDDVQFYLESAKEEMNGAIEHLNREFYKIRAGKASPAMLESVKVDYYGTISPLSQVANLSSPDAKTIFIQPWDRGVIEAIEKAIQAANLGFNPSNNGEVIRIIVPPLTEERRKQLVKQVKNEGEAAKVTIRNHRRDFIEEFKKLKKDGLAEDLAKDAEAKIHKMHEDYIRKIDEIMLRKEKEIMTV